MEDLLEIAGRQIDIFIDEQMRDELPLKLLAVRRSSSSVSFVRSSGYVLALDVACGELIKRRGIAIWEILHRCITTGRVDFSPELAKILKNFSTPYLTGTVSGLTQRAQAEANSSFQPDESETSRLRTLATLEAEIDLFCAVLARAPQPAQYQPPHVINIHGSSVAVSKQAIIHLRM